MARIMILLTNIDEVLYYQYDYYNALSRRISEMRKDETSVSFETDNWVGGFRQTHENIARLLP